MYLQKRIHICHDLLNFHDLPDLSSSSQNIFVLRGICHTTLWGWCLKVLSSILQMPTIFLHMPYFATMVAFEMLLTLTSIMRLTPTRSTFCWSTSCHHQSFYLPYTFHHILFVLSPGFFFTFIFNYVEICRSYRRVRVSQISFDVVFSAMLVLSIGTMEADREPMHQVIPRKERWVTNGHA